MFELGEADHRNVRYEIVWVFFFFAGSFYRVRTAKRRNVSCFAPSSSKKSETIFSNSSETIRLSGFFFFFVFQDFTYAVSVAQRIMNILIEMRFYLFLGNIRSYLHEYWARAGGVITIFSFSLVCLWWRWKFLWDNFTSIIISEFFEWKTYTYLFVYI